MNLFELLAKLSKSLLLIISVGYLCFLMPYFLSFNMPLQYDYNTISVFVITFFICLFLFVFLFCIFYTVDRILKVLYYKEFTIDDVLTNMDLMILSFVILLSPIFIFSLSSHKLDIFFTTYLNVEYIVFCFYIVIPLFFIVTRIIKKEIYLISVLILNSLFCSFAIIKIIIFTLNLDMIFFILLIALFTIILLLIDNYSFWNKNKIEELCLIKFYKKFFYIKNNYNIFVKINIATTILLIQILFSGYDYMFNKGKFINRFTSSALHLLNIGAFEGSFIVDNEIADILMNVNKIQVSNKYVQISSHIIWSNNQYLFIKNDMNNTISLLKSNIPIDVIKNK